MRHPHPAQRSLALTLIHPPHASRGRDQVCGGRARVRSAAGSADGGPAAATEADDPKIIGAEIVDADGSHQARRFKKALAKGEDSRAQNDEGEVAKRRQGFGEANEQFGWKEAKRQASSRKARAAVIRLRYLEITIS
jgi:hypothetical protein